MTQLLTYTDYERFRDLLHTRTGLIHRDNKWRDLGTHLRAAMQSAQIEEWDSYYTQLCMMSSDTSLWEDLVSRLTVGETYFFRNMAQFSALREQILPPLIRRRRDEGHRLLRLWSAGCASGEEPYSLAILLHELLPDIRDWSIMILATDINRNALAQAAAAIYNHHSFRAETPAYIRGRYFRAKGQSLELDPYIRQMVQFRYLNLVEDDYPSPVNSTLGLDIIVCRNVTIYFSPEATRKVVKQFSNALGTAGWLVVGHSEPQVNFYEDFGFEPRNFEKAVLYQKIAHEYANDATAMSWWAHQPVDVADTPGRCITLPDTTDDGVLRPLAVTRSAPPPEDRLLPTAVSTQENAASCFQRAKQFADQMQWADAHTWLDRTLEQDPLLVEAYFLCALVYQHTGDIPAALDALKQALYIDRKFVLGHFSVGMIHWRAGQTGAAHRAWKTARTLLNDISPEEVLPHSDGMVAGRLLSLLNGYLAGGREHERQGACDP